MPSEIITCPINGKVSSVCVSVGDAVSDSDMLCLIEAMKMLTTVESSVAGRVTEINIGEGQSVAHGEKMFVIEY